MIELKKEILEQYPKELKRHIFKHNAVLVTADTIITQNYYIESGVLKCYAYNEELKRDTIFCLLSAGDAILSSNNTPYKIPAPFDIQVIKDAVIYSISNDDLKNLRKKEPIFDEFVQSNSRQMINKLVEIAKTHTYINIIDSYKKLLEIYPFLDAIIDKDVAAILGADRATITRTKLKLNGRPKRTKSQKPKE
jgi:signal-transduction protein with cAMP-binding, CBS, and nucleotidyltransferase domain